MNETDLIEQLAAQSHTSWSHWMQYLFTRCTMQSDGSVLIPPDLVQRWQRQVNTPYAALSEREKQSDREQAACILPIIRQS